ncbi:hypothetical protein MLP_16700 [Microlunatus phosphovorus NM-1]|uniref:Type II toxin-antitoxin system RelE/ParE family toxin n=2 Tax=Microlunatus phosphovorus TaxID=29405 RepID=F5XRJ4_MICPN|nr:hypothetical protein MLP_16700 [Microlunatus phosphovorus NM-1]
MNAPPFQLVYTDEARAVLMDLERPRHSVKRKKVLKTLRLLRDIGPAHPGLNSHKYHSRSGPQGEDLWESYVDDRTPGAWRIWWIWWIYGPEDDMITIVTLGPHP